MREKRAIHKQSRDMVYDYIFKKILDGSLKFGTRLTELTISAELGVSRTPVHDALLKLVNKGIAVYTPGAGIFLREITRKDIEELMTLRRLFETHAVGVAAANPIPYLIGKMRESCTMLRELCLAMRSGNVPSLNEQWLIKNNAEIMFHLSIIQMTGNSHLIRVFSDTMVLTKTLCVSELNDRAINLSRMINTYYIHCKLCRLIEKGRSDRAVALMDFHIVTGLKSLLFNYDNQKPAPQNEIQLLDLYENLE